MYQAQRERGDRPRVRLPGAAREGLAVGVLEQQQLPGLELVLEGAKLKNVTKGKEFDVTPLSPARQAMCIRSMCGGPSSARCTLRTVGCVLPVSSLCVFKRKP